jgi:Zn-finger nucleic acid-binding protein
MTTVLSPASLRCPKCHAEMVGYERSGILVDQCRECRGIFLDHGELERLIDAESGGAGWAGPRMMPPAPVKVPGSSGSNPAYRSEWAGDLDDHRTGRSTAPGR